MVAKVLSFLRIHWPRTRLALIIGAVLAAGLLLLCSGNLFAQSRLRLSDVFFVSTEVSDSIVLVALDDASQAAYGRSPTEWSRTLYADLITELNKAEARVIAFDILFANPAEGDDAFVEALAAARTNEVRTRFVLASAGVQPSETTGNADPILHFNNLLTPIPSLGESIDYPGIVNVFADADSVIRRQPSRIAVNDETYLSFSLAAYLAYLRIPASSASMLMTVDQDRLHVTPQRQLSIDDQGIWRPNFFGPPANNSKTVFPVVSFHDVVTGEISPEMFNDKIVLVGVMNSTGMTDLYQVPSAQNGQRMAGVEIYAHAIETLIQGVPVTEQSPRSEALVIIVFTLIASTLYIHLRWHWMVLTSAILVGTWILFSFITFSTQLTVMSLFCPVLALIMPVPVHLGVQITTEFNRRLRAESLLASVVELSRQQMALDRILPKIAEDLRRILHTEQVEIWVNDAEQQALTLAWPTKSTISEPNCAKLVQQVKIQQCVISEKQCAAVPILWQGRLLAVLAAALPKQTSASSLQMVETLAHQIAPGLENAFLYTKITQQNSLLEALIAGSPAGIMVLDEQLRLGRCNHALGDMLGISLDQAGTSLINILAGSGIVEETRTNLENDFCSKDAFRQEIQYNGRTFIVDAAPLATGWIVIVNDVSALAELNALKTRMIRMASHDLKNPLQIILGYGYMLSTTYQDDLSEQHMKFVQAIVRSGETMQGIIEDILDLEQLRSGSAEHKPLDLPEIVNSVIQHHQPDIERRQQTFTAAIADNLPQVRGDARHLTQVVTNLLGNASKYTPEEGQITLRLYQPEPKTIRLEIEDTGYGISEQAQAQLFQEFYRVKTQKTENIPGTGLGLSLVKWVIEAHQGRVWVQSTEGVGSTFFVELPCI